MYVGIPNPNILSPLEKMTITPDGKPSFQVLYNPESYVQARKVRYAQSSGISTNTPVSQFAGGSLEVLQFRLFFDSMSAGSEAVQVSTTPAASADSSATVNVGDVNEYAAKSVAATAQHAPAAIQRLFMREAPARLRLGNAFLMRVTDLSRPCVPIGRVKARNVSDLG